MSFGSLGMRARLIGPALAVQMSSGGTEMFSEGGIEADAVRVSMRASSGPARTSLPGAPSSSESAFSASVVSSFPASIRAPRVALWLLLAEAAAFALAAASGKIPAFLFTAVRALLTF
jgi:hypothetical protein